MTRARTAMVIIVVSMVLAPPARAGMRKAKRHFKQAETHYSLGRFQEALDEYSAAYEEKPLPAFLFNIAQCHMELKHWERALFFYEGFLREKPKSQNRALVEERMAEARARLEAAEAEARRTEELRLAAEEAKRQEEERKRAEAERQRAEEERKTAEARAAEEAAALKAVEVQAAVTREEADAFYKTWWFWTIVGGVAATGAGVAIGLTAGGGTRTVLPSGSIGTIDAR